MPQEFLNKPNKNVDTFYEVFHENPLVFMSNAKLTKVLSPYYTVNRAFESDISNIVGLIRTQRMAGGKGDRILTIESSHGYIYVPSQFSKKYFIPKGFRDSFVGGNHAYKNDVDRVIEQLRTVDIVDSKLGQPRAAAAIYEDFILFESQFDTFVQLPDYARAMNISSTESVSQRTARLQSFLDTVKGNRITIEPVYGTIRSRMTISQ